MKIHSLKSSTFMLLIAAALTAPLAFAQSDTTASAPAPASAAMQPGAMAPDAMSQSSAPKTWRELDTNNDGKLSKDEVAGDLMWSSHFDAADANKDGFISKAEFKKHAADMENK